MTNNNTWIVGASAGIGAALARELASRGHNVALSARDAEALQQLKGELAAGEHLVAALDVGDYATVQQAQSDILQSWERIDRVVFMAGIYQPMPMTELDLEQCRAILEVNLLGALHLSASVLPHLLAHPGSQIAFCASVAGYRGLPRSQPYGASKAGLINLAESLRAEHGKRLDVRLINPGFVESRLTAKNDFHMPMRISAGQAARAIARGLDSSAFEIHFPRLFTYTLKLLGVLPNWLYYKIISKA